MTSKNCPRRTQVFTQTIAVRHRTQRNGAIQRPMLDGRRWGALEPLEPGPLVLLGPLGPLVPLELEPAMVEGGMRKMTPEPGPVGRVKESGRRCYL